MNGLGTIKVVMGLCIASVAGSAWPDSNAFVGRWHSNRTQPAGEPVLNDVTAEISRVDSTHVQWSLTVLASQGQTSVETFDALANGEFYPISNDTTAAFRLGGKHPSSDVQGSNRAERHPDCTLAADRKKMTCQGVLSSGEGRTTTYVEVYHRM
jgi:hypothetical protein